jgi:ABC-type transport system substrate-binding protein
MFEPLVEVDARFNLRPLLATSWSFSDPTTLVLRLRRGVRFQNGEPFTSSAVRYTLDREIGSASPRAQEVAGVESVATPSPDVAVLRLRRADPALLYRLAGPAGMMVSQVAVAAQGSAAEFGRNPVVAGTGPFAFQFWRRGYHLILKRNPRYWGPAPYLDQLDFTQVSPKPALPRLEASDLDVVERLDPAGVSQAEQDANLVTGSRTGFVYSGLLLNQAPGAVFTNPARRQVVASIAPLGAALLTPRSWAYDPTLRPPPRPAAGPGFSFSL